MSPFDPPPDFVPPTNLGFPSGYPANPYLYYRPIFARSLPIQILVTGITLTLVAVLLIQLIFSAPSHLRIARTNFFLQVSSALSLLAWELASLILILNESGEQSQRWPFMLDYIAIDFPPLVDPHDRGRWSMAALIAWLFLNAMVSVLTQVCQLPPCLGSLPKTTLFCLFSKITHIQFLTLMYPSRLEGQLIFILLGPLAVIAALTQFAPLHPNPKIVSTASAVRNVCNATLTILFALSLAIWGFGVNRKQAWRTDGGTAIFGAGAIFLSLASTAFTIAYIPSRDQFEWMPGLTAAIVLWQTFLGWWWWVGAGMGMGEVEEWLRRAEKRQKRRLAREARRKDRKDRLRGAWNSITGAPRTTASSTAIDKSPSGMTTVPRRHAGSSDSDSLVPSSKSDDASTMERRIDDGHNQGRWWCWPWTLARRTYCYVRNAHISATRRDAIERAEHIREVFGVDGSPADIPATSGWALGSFGLREREAAEAAFEMEGVERLVGLSRSEAAEDEADMDRQKEGEAGTGRWDARPRGREREHPRELETNKTPADTNSSSSLWWGPLRRWRLQDSTEYSERP